MKVTEQAGKAFRPRGRSDLHVKEVGEGAGGRRLNRKILCSRAALRSFGSSRRGKLYPQAKVVSLRPLALAVIARPSLMPWSVTGWELTEKGRLPSCIPWRQSVSSTTGQFLLKGELRLLPPWLPSSFLLGFHRLRPSSS